MLTPIKIRNSYFETQIILIWCNYRESWEKKCGEKIALLAFEKDRFRSSPSSLGVGCPKSMIIWGRQQNIHSHISCLILFFYYASFCVTIFKYVSMITHFPFQYQFLIDFYPIITEMSLHSHVPVMFLLRKCMFIFLLCNIE